MLWHNWQQVPARIVSAAALALGVMALANHFIARRTERRYPPSGQFITVEGVRLHYREQGKGPPVVLLHGNGAMVEDFTSSGLFDALAADHRVIVFDRPGFGHSQRPRGRIWTVAAQAKLLHQAMLRLGAERPVLVGHSWGTLVALAMALEHQAEVRALVLLAGYYRPTRRLDVSLVSLLALPVLGTLARYTILPLLGRLVLPRLLRQIFAPAPVAPGFRAGFPVAMALRPSQLRASAADTALMIPGVAALHHRYGELTLPVRILGGTEDCLVETRYQALHLHRQIGQSLLQQVEGAGHMIHHSAPALVLAAIRSIPVPLPDDRGAGTGG